MVTGYLGYLYSNHVQIDRTETLKYTPFFLFSSITFWIIALIKVNWCINYTERPLTFDGPSISLYNGFAGRPYRPFIEPDQTSFSSNWFSGSRQNTVARVDPVRILFNQTAGILLFVMQIICFIARQLFRWNLKPVTGRGWNTNCSYGKTANSSNVLDVWPSHGRQRHLAADG